MTSKKDYIWSYKGQPIWMTKAMQKVILGTKHTRFLDICYPLYQLQQAHGPSGSSYNNSFKNKNIALYCYFSVALFVAYS